MHQMEFRIKNKRVYMVIIMSIYCTRTEMRECIFNKGQSKRIWNELYKV